MVAPTITISDRTIADRMVTSARHVAIDQVRIEWGRETLFDEPAPGVATIRIINRGIDTKPPRKGEPIRVSYPSFGDVFRGTIAETDTTVDYLHHGNGLREKITETVITAHDALAAVTQFLPAGPAEATSGHSEYSGIGGWDPQYISARVDDVMAAGAGGFVDQYARPSSIVQETPEVRAFLAPRKPNNDSALDLLHCAYSMIRPLSTFTYAPHEHRIYSAQHQPAAMATVTLTGTPLRIELQENVYTIPARLVEIDSTKLGSPAEDIALVRIEYVRMEEIVAGSRYEYSDCAATRPVPGAAGARTYVAPEKQFYPANPTGSPWVEIRSYPSWWLATAAATFAAINGNAQLPALTIDPESPELAETGQTFHTFQRGRAFYLNGSMFNGQPGAPAVVQIIGGVLTYDAADGWRHALRPASTAGGAPRTLTIAEMFPTASDDRLDSWDDRLTINDLAAVTRRA